MKMALRKLEFSNGKISKMESGDDYLVLVDADSVQFSTIKSWGLMKWDKGKQALYGPITIELLDKLASIVRLPPAPAQRRQSLHAVQDAVDRERTNDTPVPLANYPVKMPLYSHQTRGANMALLTFGWVRPTGGAAQ